MKLPENNNKQSWFKRHWSNILFVVILVLLIVPQTRLPIQVALNKLIAFSPSELSQDQQEHISNYDWLLERDNEKINFSNSKSKVVVINYWATWCGPCIAEMQSLQDLYNRYKENIDFYFITSDDKTKVNTFLKNNNYNLPVYYSLSVPPEKLRSSSLPTTYVVSKQGNIIMYKVGAADWNSESVHNTLNRLIK
ncbi:TlpA family protein disulfide reductase [Psychroflexus sp. ALD_RP9]|uniref:TlpA family protein disulfide reductase n=1 Tax=Psychroflexus sp. ALD_RP9 TaxID=2777186 RepID=UPI001A8DB9D2|nr:TlpA disulfide reductase family protein [Psychroflexus sp. ALD_RP9]QSS97577.1 TlpA family protein disulfide reductase [Psychroflexus sp. ALD_RP9]